MGGLTFSQWIAIADFLVKSEPAIVEFFRAEKPAIAVLMDAFHAAKSDGHGDEKATNYAAASAMNWLDRNGAAAIREQEQADRNA